MRHLLIAFTVLFATNVAFAQDTPMGRFNRLAQQGETKQLTKEEKAHIKRVAVRVAKDVAIAVLSTRGGVKTSKGRIITLATSTLIKNTEKFIQEKIKGELDKDTRAVIRRSVETKEVEKLLNKGVAEAQKRFTPKPQSRPKPKPIKRAKSKPKRSKSRRSREIDRSHLHEMRRQIRESVDRESERIDRMDHNELDRQQQALDRAHTA